MKITLFKFILIMILVIKLSGCAGHQVQRTKQTNNEGMKLELIQKEDLNCIDEMAENVLRNSCLNYMSMTNESRYLSDQAIIKKRDKYEKFIKIRKEQELKERLESTYSSQSLSTLEDEELCVQFWSGVRYNTLANNPMYDKNIVAEMKKRGLKGEHIELARKGSASIGVPVCIVYAAFGRPVNENRTVTKYGIAIQYIYKNFYIYSENGVITSWQD